MKCPKCKAENSETARFCSNCASKLDLSDHGSFTRTLETGTDELTRGTVFAGRYEIIEELGAGGMGRVYRAHDTKLNEEVALKLIKSEIAAERRVVERFRNELKTARKIAHKNVCRMYDFHEEGKTLYLTMEYVRGEDLKSLLHRTKTLTVGVALSISRQIAEGLGEAHKLGITHRDLKPGNIMIDKDGQPKIMDFGIARVRQEKGITGEGAVIGTPEYMSPEQVEGKPADARSDMYALGVILFEMLVGRAPFEGETPFSIATKHKTEPPPIPKKLVPQIPEGLSKLILRCLEKDKAKRYQTAEGLVIDLSAVEQALPVTDRIAPKARIKTSHEITVKFTPRKLIMPAAVVILVVALVVALFKFVPKKPAPSSQPLSVGAVDSIAVLPFENLSRDSTQDYFSDGMAEELISKLYVISSLRVSSFRSVKDYRSSKKTYREIAAELNVKAILDAAVLRVADRVRITAKLIDPVSERPLWTGNYEQEMKDILALQSEISQTIVREIRLKLTPQEQNRLASGQQVDPTAYEYYVKARQIQMSLTIDPSLERWQTGLDELEKAANLAPRFAPIYAEIVKLCALNYLVGKSYNEVIGRAEAAAEKARLLDPDSPETHLAIGMLDILRWDWIGAGKELGSAVELAPGNPDAHFWYSILLLSRAHFDEGLAQLKRAIQIDPAIDPDGAWLGGSYENAKRYDEAIAVLREGLQRKPRSVFSHNFLAFAYSMNGQHSEAVAEAEKSLSLLSSAEMTALHLNLAYVYANVGRKNDARRILNEYFASRKGKSVDGLSLAEVYAIMGERDEAFKWLGRGYREHDQWMYILKVDPGLDPLRSDPRFKELLKKVGFE